MAATEHQAIQTRRCSLVKDAMNTHALVTPTPIDLGFARRPRRGYLVPRPGAGGPSTLLGRSLQGLQRLVLGRPIPTAGEAGERLSKITALAVFSSDALSSVAYATEEIMKVLLLVGIGALTFTLPVSLVIVALMAIVVVSYRQTIKAYPQGGGSYIVASDNLGTLPGLTAAASLLLDYVLTVAVSVAAGVAAITSLWPDLLPYTVPIAVGAVVLITVANLRGLRESGALFAVPAYLFVGLVLALVAVGLFRLATGSLGYTPPESALAPGSQSLGVFLMLSAFAQGCTAMTGTEAISDGVPAFKAPEARNARTTILAMALVLGSMFLGLSFLATHLGVVPATEETVLSQLGRTVFGMGPVWWLLQLATALILLLAANTSFADFPRLASFLARDHFLPRMFGFRGSRLAFTVGIVSLAVLASALLVIFQGSLDLLIPLYAVGVFASFTLSQSGMVVHWRKERGPNWRRSAAINGVGAAATGLVTVVIASTKFMHGAWLVLVLVPLIVSLFWAIRRHYARMDAAQQPEMPLDPRAINARAVVPVANLGVPARQALAFARAVAPGGRVTAVHVTDNPEQAEEMKANWEACPHGNAELVVIESPFRTLEGPLLTYIDAVRESNPDDTLVVLLPEYVPNHWWEHLLHNQTALRLKAKLLFHPGVVVANVPYHLGAAA
jgi:amino acid transporter